MDTVKYTLDNITSIYINSPNRCDPCSKIIQSIINLLKDTMIYAKVNPLNDDELFKYIFNNKQKYNIFKFIHPEHAPPMQTKLDYILSVFTQFTENLVEMINVYNSLHSNSQIHYRENFLQRCKESEAQIPCFELNIEHIYDMTSAMRRPPTPPPIISFSNLEFQSDGGFSVFYNQYQDRITKEKGLIKIGLFIDLVIKCFKIAL